MVLFSDGGLMQAVGTTKTTWEGLERADAKANQSFSPPKIQRFSGLSETQKTGPSFDFHRQSRDGRDGHGVRGSDMFGQSQWSRFPRVSTRCAVEDNATFDSLLTLVSSQLRDAHMQEIQVLETDLNELAQTLQSLGHGLPDRLQKRLVKSNANLLSMINCGSIQALAQHRGSALKCKIRPLSPRWKSIASMAGDEVSEPIPEEGVKTAPRVTPSVTTATTLEAMWVPSTSEPSPIGAQKGDANGLKAAATVRLSEMTDCMNAGAMVNANDQVWSDIVELDLEDEESDLSGDSWGGSSKGLDFINSNVERWGQLVIDLLNSESKELFLLRPTWIRSEPFMRKALRAHPQVNVLQKIGRGTKEYRASQYMRSSWLMDHHFKASGLWAKLSQFDSSKLIIDPHSPKRIAWALAGLLLMVYDLIMLPMQVFSLPDNFFLTGMAWFSQLFWTIDMFVSAVTSYYVNGELECRLKKITISYATSWMPIDAVITIPLWFVLFLGSGSGAQAGRSMRSARYMRVLRFLRLMRLVKFESLWGEAMTFINSASMVLLIGMGKLMFLIFLVNHIIACLWFLVGDQLGHGWAKTEYVRDRGILYKYLSAVHWSLTQFQGTSDISPGTSLAERLFAVVYLLCSLFILAIFISSLTNSMMQFQNLHAKRTYEQRVVRGYLSHHEISHHLSVRIKKYLEWKQRLIRIHEYDNEVFNILPHQLMMDLLDEVRAPSLCYHLFFVGFRDSFPRVVRRVCFEALSPLSPMPGELVFSPGDACLGMYWVVSGNLSYVHSTRRKRKTQTPVRMTTHTTVTSRDKSQVVEQKFQPMQGAQGNAATLSHIEDTDYAEEHISKGCALSEPVLWTYWSHAGSLHVVSDASLLVLSPEKFEDVILSSASAQASVVLYARRFVAALNQYGKHYHDYISPYQLQKIMTSSFLDEDDCFNDEENGKQSEIEAHLSELEGECEKPRPDRQSALKRMLFLER